MTAATTLDVRSVLAASLERLLALYERPSEYPFAALSVANRMAAEAAALLRTARDIEAAVYAQLGRFGAEAVDRAARAADPEVAATMVAESFPSLCPLDGENASGLCSSLITDD